MALQLKIDQAGKPAGVPGQAREDLATGVAVLFTATGGPFLAYRWEIVSKPIDILTPVRSAAVFATSTASASLLSPIDLAGTYLVRCTVDSGNGLGADLGDVVEIDFYAGPELATDPVRLPRRWPAAFEQLTHNVPDAIDPAGNTEGWSREWLKWREIMFRSCVWAAGLVSAFGDPLNPILVRGFGGTISYQATGQIKFTFDTPMLDDKYLVLCSVDSVGGSSGQDATCVAAEKLTTSFTIWTTDRTNNVLADEIPFSFEVKLGLDP